jgi:uncharacterized protein (UPF0332 family)
MSIDEKKKLLALHRLQQAAESLQEAQYLFAGGKSLRSVVNRVYYGMFYAVLALLIYDESSIILIPVTTTDPI